MGWIYYNVASFSSRYLLSDLRQLFSEVQHGIFKWIVHCLREGCALYLIVHCVRFLHCVRFCIVLAAAGAAFCCFFNLNLSKCILQLFYKCFICMNKRSKNRKGFFLRSSWEKYLVPAMFVTNYRRRSHVPAWILILYFLTQTEFKCARFALFGNEKTLT